MSRGSCSNSTKGAKSSYPGLLAKVKVKGTSSAIIRPKRERESAVVELFVVAAFLEESLENLERISMEMMCATTWPSLRAIAGASVRLVPNTIVLLSLLLVAQYLKTSLSVLQQRGYIYIPHMPFQSP